MSRARVVAQQQAVAAKPMRMVRGTVQNTSGGQTLVAIQGGTPVRIVPVPGVTYIAGMAVLVFIQEPAVGPAYPLT